MGIVNVQGFFVLVNEGRGFVVGEKGSLRPVVLIFYSSCQNLEQKNSLDLMLRNGSDSVLEESLEKIKPTMSKCEEEDKEYEGFEKGQNPRHPVPSVNYDCREWLNLWWIREARSVRICSFLDNTRLVGIEPAGFVQKKAQTSLFCS